jgi:hypothetical protein
MKPFNEQLLEIKVAKLERKIAGAKAMLKACAFAINTDEAVELSIRMLIADDIHSFVEMLDE